MRYPTMGSNQRNAVSVPALSGGINLNDALNLVDDNQMTDCKNVWYKDGILQTRPGIISKFDFQMNSVSSIYPNAEIIKNTVCIDDVEYKLAVTLNNTEMYIYCLSPQKTILNGTPFICKSIYAVFTADTVPDSYVFFNGKSTKENGKGLYMLTTLANGTVKLYELVGDDFQLLTSDELYSPIVYVNGKGDAYVNLPASEDSEYASASFFEGYNALTGAWASYYFTTDEQSNSFTMPTSFFNCYLDFEYTDPVTGNVYESGSFKAEDYINGFADRPNGYGNAFTIDGISIFVSVVPISKVIYFWEKNPNYEEGSENQPEYLAYSFQNALGALANNLRIKVRPITASKSVLAGATISASFGGGADGIFNGTRTFLSGVKKGDNRNILVWSDLNNPTYFSENNYAYVGDTTQRITALEKQDDMLIIFKTKSLYYSVYSAGTTYTAEDVLAGKVVDVSTLGATFPVIQIHSEIGCDLPNTIKLCGDRLVWACRDNRVYMLRSANQYSMVNVSLISHMLGDNLNLSVLDATATCYDGFYLLKSNNKIYLMNYDQYYFTALPSYSDSKKAGRKMQWYIWELPEVETFAAEFISDAESLALLIYIKRPDGVQPFIWEFVNQTIEDGYHLQDGTLITVPVENVIQTKMFDFGAMERFKSIEQLYVEFGKAEGEIDLEYLTERGRLDAIAFEINGEKEENSPEFIKTKRFLPGIKRALRFGLRITAKGRVALGGILIKFKYMGVMR